MACDVCKWDANGITPNGENAPHPTNVLASAGAMSKRERATDRPTHTVDLEWISNSYPYTRARMHALAHWRHTAEIAEPNEYSAESNSWYASMLFHFVVHNNLQRAAAAAASSQQIPTFELDTLLSSADILLHARRSYVRAEQRRVRRPSGSERW